MPLELVQCAECSLVQLRHNFRQDDLFRQTYGYRSGLNESMVAHLSGLVAEVLSRVTPHKGDVVLDIGSNDGTTLGFYRTSGLVRIGIDPTINLFKQYYQPGILTVADFFTAETFRSIMPSSKARFVTSIAMFYDLPDPNAFVQDIRDILAPDGIWVLEQSYLPTMVSNLSFDTICHEHLEYYGLSQIKLLMERNGLRVIDASLIDVNGGSIRVIVGHRDGPHKTIGAAVDVLLRREQVQGYQGAGPLIRLRQSISDIRARVRDFLIQSKREGRLVHGYGASTKGNTLLQYFGIKADLISAIADRNPTKFGCRTPGSAIPIISEDESRAQNPDYYFVLPWHFHDNFVARERHFLEQGGALVFPLPKFEIVTAKQR